MTTIAIKLGGAGDISRLNTRTAKMKEVKMEHNISCKCFMISLKLWKAQYKHELIKTI